MERVAFISLHTSPLAQPGAGDSGGMNVYVRELAAALAQSGVECITYVRADRPGLPREVRVEPHHTVVHIEAGEYHLPKEALVDVLDEATAAILADIERRGGVDVVHAHLVEWRDRASHQTCPRSSLRGHLPHVGAGERGRRRC
ncbi:MAG: hypothetical protein EBS20_04315 [Actinobacteria bacterium]|nr:hypothetical protein [Actinomycetota bacterium]